MPEPSVRVERRLSAILAADVAGYSRLMGIDEVGTARSLREHRAVCDALVTKHGGRIVKTTGDGLLVEFASVVDAVECALAVQAVMAERNAGIPQERSMVFRIGINLGDILIDGDDILGDGVNIAARLESIATPGGIYIASSAYEQVCGKVAAGFVDLGERRLKNIVRPVRVYAVATDGSNSEKSGGAVQSATSAPRLSIVVLPLLNISGDPEQDYFVDGVTESLTSDLSCISGSFVIACNTAFTFKGKYVDVRQVGRELNVRYALEGSVQRGGNRLRVNVQLIDAETGNHLWAERFDKPLADLFDIQDEIVSRLANTLNAQLIVVEARRAAHSSHPDAMDLYFQGWASMNKGPTPEYAAQARNFFERALALDPANVEALLGKAYVDFQAVNNLFADDRAARMAAAEKAALKALSYAPGHAMANRILGLVQINTNRVDQGIAQSERALALDRNLASAHASIGMAKYFVGRGEETESHIQKALRLSPRDPSAHLWMMFAGVAKLWHGADTEAVGWLRRSIEANRNNGLGYFYLAAALAHFGEVEKARAAAQAGRAILPEFTIRRYRATSSCTHPAYLAGRERTYEGMRKAGLPEE